jgi:hypothetical protein
LKISEFGISEFEISEFEISEFEISEFEISEFEILEFEILEFGNSECTDRSRPVPTGITFPKQQILFLTQFVTKYKLLLE